MGAGIGAMHYIGMAAMRMAAMMLIDPVLFAISILVAVALATIAAYAGSLATSKGGTAFFNWPKFGGALLMGCAVAGMHYTGMAAAHFSRATALQFFTPARAWLRSIWAA